MCALSMTASLQGDRTVQSQSSFEVRYAESGACGGLSPRPARDSSRIVSSVVGTRSDSLPRSYIGRRDLSTTSHSIVARPLGLTPVQVASSYHISRRARSRARLGNLLPSVFGFIPTEWRSRTPVSSYPRHGARRTTLSHAAKP